ncbi:MAG: hypothetical protein A3B37_03210 [Candidatus Sungbacteria bacterium RIFCSPLOWO2_01_FULL_59_16]|uniref:Uncharacterized protein n=1 Tax=Candidatus Sungbacteria bacterium RIFCSPLOWO2_01_FULL_59_16 TaxID=1802280 RepID=A0A1G2LBC7_9BACT|nr:MAG: hypothetical protein A3B37_03210 [Candidatus Sungbacteria bacterium RIFCSPLOWO2_01_FULL_59_16]
MLAVARDKTVEGVLKRVLLIKQLARETCEWAPQGSDALRRLLDVGASLFIAMQAARGGYLPTSWIGDADIAMKRVNERVAEFAADDADAQMDCYEELLPAILLGVVAAREDRFEEHLRELKTGAGVES